VTPHLLLTAWAYPPARTSGVYRAAGIADAFARAGWEVTVLSGPADLFQRNEVFDTSLAAGLHPRIEVVEVPLEHHELSTDLTRWSWLRARHPELWARRRLRRDLRAFPEAWYGSWAPALRTAASRVHAAHPVSLALGTAAPYVDFVPGEHLHQTHGVPYVLDYRDAWTFRTFTGAPPENLTEAVRSREASLMRDALRVWFVNDPIRRWHADAYPDAASAMRTVRNGFDLPAGVSDPDDVVADLRPAAGRGLVFGYIGTVNFGAFPLEALVGGWRRALPALPEGSQLLLCGHLGRTGEGSPELRAALAAAEAWAIRYEGPVERGQVWDVYREFDALVLALPSGPGVTSGKVYEYAATGLPIVSVHTPETPVHEVLGDAPQWHAAASLGADDVARAFVDAAHQIAHLTPADRKVAAAAGRRWERSGLLRAAIDDIALALEEAEVG